VFILPNKVLRQLCGHVQSLVNYGGNGFDFGTELLFYLVEVETVLEGYEVDG